MRHPPAHGSFHEYNDWSLTAWRTVEASKIVTTIGVVFNSGLRGPARAGFLGPARLTLGALFGEVVEDPQLARGPLLKTISIVVVRSGS